MVPNGCPKCISRKVSVINYKSVLNPLKGSCNNKSCKNTFYFRHFLFLNFSSNTSMSDNESYRTNVNRKKKMLLKSDKF